MAEGIELRVQGLVKRFGKIEALSGLDLATEGDWGCLGLLGRNGAGKSTFLRILTGLMNPTSGTISISLDGKEYSHADPVLAVYIAEQQTVVDALTG